jgi:hypothetical protein
MPYTLPGEENPLLNPISNPKTEEPKSSTDPLNPPKPNPSNPIPPNNSPGRLLFDKFRAGETRFTSLKYTDAKDGFNKQITDEPIVATIPNRYIGVSPSVQDAALENKKRIIKFFESPKGKSFINKQIGLQLSNTRLELSAGVRLNSVGEGPGIANFVNQIVGTANSAIGFVNRTANQRFRTTELLAYNSSNTAEQIGSSIGTHFDRFGPTPYINDNLKYINIASVNNSGTESPNNRLVALKKQFNLGVSSSGTNIIGSIKAKLRSSLRGVSSLSNTATSIAFLFGGNPKLEDINRKINNINEISAPYLDPLIDQYIGGPSSLNGLGTTNIRRFDNTANNDAVNGKSISKSRFNKKSSRSGGLLNQSKDTYLGSTLAYSEISGFSLPVEIAVPVEVPKLAESGLSINNIFTQIRAQQVKPHISYGGVDIKFDAVQTQYSYLYKELQNVDISILGFRKNVKTSKIPLFSKYGRLEENDNLDRKDSENMSIVFQLLNPFATNDTEINAGRIIFPAYINNFKVNTDATWTDVSYIGRSENLYVYDKFKRQVSFGFQIPCFNPVELRDNHRSLGALESSLAGKYKGHKLGGILTKLYFGNYFEGETGIINSISYEIPNDSSWDIDEKLAHNINVSINFTVIHNDLPTYSRAGGFLKNIKKSANDFIISEKAFDNTGANSNPGLKKFTKYIKVSRTDVNSIKESILSESAENKSIRELDNEVTGLMILQNASNPSDSELDAIANEPRISDEEMLARDEMVRKERLGKAIQTSVYNSSYDDISLENLNEQSSIDELKIQELRKSQGEHDDLLKREAVDKLSRLRSGQGEHDQFLKKLRLGQGEYEESLKNAGSRLGGSGL